MPRIKLLFLAANTDSDAHLELEREYEQIRRYLEVTPEWDALEIVFEPKATAISLPQLCEREKPDIIHFAGHADKNGRLKVHQPDGGVGRIEPAALGRLFEATTAQVKLVVFNACYSKLAANAIQQNVPFRIGTRGEIDDEVAIQFSAFFYQGLGFGRTVWEAYKYARAGVALTLGETPPDQIAELDESSKAQANDFRLKSTRVEQLEQVHDEEVKQLKQVHGEEVEQLKQANEKKVKQLREAVRKWGMRIAALVILASVAGSWLLFPVFGWLSPGVASEQAKSARTKDDAIAAFTSTETFLKHEIDDLGGDTTPPVSYPSNNLIPDVKTATDEWALRPIKEETHKEAEQSAMDEWRSDILTHTRGPKEALLVARSGDDFKPPYKSCRYTLQVSSSVRLTRAAAFLVRDGGGDTAYRPTYRQMELQFVPDSDRQGTLFINRPRGGESLLIYLWVSSLPTDGKVINAEPKAFFDVILTDMVPND